MRDEAEGPSGDIEAEREKLQWQIERCVRLENQCKYQTARMKEMETEMQAMREAASRRHVAMPASQPLPACITLTPPCMQGMSPCRPPSTPSLPA